MRHTSGILKELGFNEDAPETTKQAFLKHLHAAMKAEKSTSSSTLKSENLLRNSSAPEQLSFDFNDQKTLDESAAEPVLPKIISHG
jgi:hypothetical protein